MTLYKWSQIAASNATADPSINWQEGQAPSSVNDSGRAMMASVAKHRDDIAGAIVTGGTSTAYTISSYEVFDTLARLNGQIIAFTPHATNGATVTLNVDGLGAKPLRSAPSTELLAGVLIQGTPYVATYSHSDGAWYLHNFYGNPYNVPLGAGIDFWGSTAPNAAFAFPIGQAISRATYASLFAIMGTTYGSGDGSTTFNLPDKRGRVSAMIDAAGTRLTGTFFPNAGSIGTIGGADGHNLATQQIPTLTASGNNNISVLSTVGGIPSGCDAGNYFAHNNQNFGIYGPGRNGVNGPVTIGQIISQGTNSISVTTQGTTSGTGVAHNNVQPTIVCNYIIRIL